MNMKEEIVKALRDAVDEIFLEWQAKLHITSGDISPQQAMCYEEELDRLAELIKSILEMQPKVRITSVLMDAMSYKVDDFATDYNTIQALKVIQDKIEEKRNEGN